MNSRYPLRCTGVAVAVFVALIVSSCADDEVDTVQSETSIIAQQEVLSVEQSEIVLPLQETQSLVVETPISVEPELEPEAVEDAPMEIDLAATDSDVERSYAMNDELNEMVAKISTLLPDYQADAFRQEQDSWEARGFRCPDGPGYHSCIQYHMKKRIRTLRHRVEDVSTSAVMSKPKQTN